MTQNTENVPVVGAPGANQDTSAGQVAPTSSLDVEALKQALGPYIEDVVKRSAQSTKDRRINQLETQQKDFKSQLARLEELQKTEGLSRSQAIQYMEMQEFLDKSGTAAVEPGVHQPDAGQAAQQSAGAGAKIVEGVLSALGLDPKSPDGIAVLRDTDITSQLEQVVALAKKRKEALERPANAAQLMGAAGGSTPPNELDATTTRVDEMIKSPHKAGLKELDAELKKLEAQVKASK